MLYFEKVIIVSGRYGLFIRDESKNLFSIDLDFVDTSNIDLSLPVSIRCKFVPPSNPNGNLAGNLIVKDIIQ